MRVWAVILKTKSLESGLVCRWGAGGGLLDRRQKCQQFSRQWSIERKSVAGSRMR